MVVYKKKGEAPLFIKLLLLFTFILLSKFVMLLLFVVDSLLSLSPEKFIILTKSFLEEGLEIELFLFEENSFVNVFVFTFIFFTLDDIIFF